MGVFFISEGWKSSRRNHMPPTPDWAEVEIKTEVIGDDVKRNEPPATDAAVLDNEAGDIPTSAQFLYNEEEKITIIEAESANSQLLEKAIAPTSDIEENKAETQPATADSANSDEPAQEDLDKLYEEELPEDIIEEQSLQDDGTDSEFTHIYTKNIKDIDTKPTRKPFYFGENSVIAIVIDDMGISLNRTKDIASLQAPLTVSFLTYGKNLEQQVQNSVDAGHEVMLHTPMEPHSKADVAPDVLTTQMTPDEIQQKLKVMLAKFSGIRGINNHMGSKLTEDYSRMQAVMVVLKEHGLFFLDSKTSAKSKAEKAAADACIPYAHRHVFLDNTNDKAYILGQLKKTENLARKNGYVIAIGHPKTGTYAALSEWLPTLKDKQIRLVPLTEIVKILNPHYEIEPL